MSVLPEVLAANETYAATFGELGSLALPPARHFAILTCMDARLDPAKYAGLSEGDAHVIRNAGGRASDDALRSLVISYKLLGTADGADFDKRYMESMGLQAHRDTVALFEKGARDARDPDVKAFAQKTLPKLKQHLEMAQQVAGEVGVGADKVDAARKP